MTLLEHASTSGEVDADGYPVWSIAEGTELAPGVQAWRRLGVGGRCEAWLGWSRLLWAPVLIKLPRPHQVDHPRARAALTREVRALAGVLHPHLPRLYRADLDSDLPHLIEEYIDGPDLEDLFATRHISTAALALLGTQLLSALVPLHARGVGHLDVKPANVVLRDGRPVLVDLGSSRPLGSPQPTGRPVGTPRWTSPEMEACAPVSVSMDVYGVGAVLADGLRRRWPWSRSIRLERAVDLLTAPDPADRPDLNEALRLVARSLPAGTAWPTWARPRTVGPTGQQ